MRRVIGIIIGILLLGVAFTGLFIITLIVRFLGASLIEGMNKTISENKPSIESTFYVSHADGYIEDVPFSYTDLVLYNYSGSAEFKYYDYKRDDNFLVLSIIDNVAKLDSDGDGCFDIYSGNFSIEPTS